jgi:hypothetical protein
MLKERLGVSMAIIGLQTRESVLQDFVAEYASLPLFRAAVLVAPHATLDASAGSLGEIFMKISS